MAIGAGFRFAKGVMLCSDWQVTVSGVALTYREGKYSQRLADAPLPRRPASDSIRLERGGSPMSSDFCFHGQSNPATTRSRLPMNFCHP